MDFSLLSENINKWYRLTRKAKKKGKLRINEMLYALGESISAIESIQTQSTKLFFSRNGSVDKEKYKEIVANIKRFQDTFVAFEQKAMKDFKIEKSARESLIIRLRKIRKDHGVIEEGTNPLDLVKEIKKRLVDLKKHIEKIDKEKKEYVFLEQKKNVEKNVKNNAVLYIMGGIALNAIDYAVEAFDLPIITDISKGYGQHLTIKGKDMLNH